MVLETPLKLASGGKCFLPFSLYVFGTVSKMCFDSGKDPSS